MPPLVEACVDSVSGAAAAAAAGAGRLELCAGLVEGGTTPSAGLIGLVRSVVAIPVHVLVRPRAGDFLYDEAELAVMRGDLAAAAALGADGVVVGALDASGDVASDALRALIEAARPMAVTFHRAFDFARDPERSLDVLMTLGVERLLSSGQAPTAEAGIPLLRRLVDRAGDRLTVVAGGGVTAANARRIVLETGAREVHLSGRVRGESPMRFRRETVRAGSSELPGEYQRVTTDPGAIAAVVAALSS
ncbi:MAG: copper homeostasis protein CutC [Gemmatimonadales bacterium]